jgi:predicted nucleic acid-binding protein
MSIIIHKQPRWENPISIITAIEFIRGISEEKQKKVFDIFKEMFEIIEIDLSMIIPFSKIYRDLKNRGELIDDASINQ